MSRPTFKIILRTDKEQQDGHCPLYLRITHKRRNSFKYLDFKVKAKDWDKKTSKARKSHRNSTRLNNYLNKVLIEYEDAYLRQMDGGGHVTSETIKKSASNTNQMDFLKFFNDHLDQRLKDEKYGTHDKERAVLNKLSQFINKKTLSFSEIDYHLLESFREHLRDHYNNGINTIHGNFRVLRMLLNNAERQDLIKIESNPFRKFKLERAETQREYLTLEELGRIKDLDLNPKLRIHHHKQMFLFACYACGLRVSDVLSLKWANVVDDHIEIVMNKTQRNLRFKLQNEANIILDQYRHRIDQMYVFPFLTPQADNSLRELDRKLSSCTAYYNKDLKIIARKCNIEKNVSSHIARHTFATSALQQGMRIEYLSKLLGHTSIRTTQIYSKIINVELDAAVDKLHF